MAKGLKANAKRGSAMTGKSKVVSSGPLKGAKPGEGKNKVKKR